jgi:hypothetical protein
MVNKMTTQDYLMVNESTNIVDNCVVWDGNSDTWQPPAGYLMLVDLQTPALDWDLNADKTDWILVEKLGAGTVGFTWNTTTQILTTNKPKPPAINRE